MLGASYIHAYIYYGYKTSFLKLHFLFRGKYICKENSKSSFCQIQILSLNYSSVKNKYKIGMTKMHDLCSLWFFANVLQKQIKFGSTSQLFVGCCSSFLQLRSRKNVYMSVGNTHEYQFMQISLENQQLVHIFRRNPFSVYNVCYLELINENAHDRNKLAALFSLLFITIGE